ncbi:prosaposin-like isoform X2 [Metopolophium dirhodum]|uniref:prosaposin-like isoform X2 n=1 Tax=Metopolophium dirhodum TaxID=44670 RepID=UPI00298FE98B|nr:prosaposin-like isoform X2 [Metopolophium dirhodum]
MTAAAGGVRFCGPLAFFGLVALLSFGASADAETVIVQRHVQMLGSQECTYGPAFWCKNITNAAGCKAVTHCIQTTWVTQKYPEDNDDICTICKNMVKEARDTLTSNVTLEELKEVFDGSCELLPLKIVKKECKKLSDDFIPELVDTLASQMDPNVVCTVSGLCNNAHIDKLLLENKEKQSTVNSEHHECEKCAIAMNKGEDLVQSMSRDDILNRFLMMCGELSSYSDACSSIVLTYHNEIYSAVKNGFNKRNVCLLSGMCSAAFHPHADGYEKSMNALMGVEISNAGERGRIQIQKSNEVSDELTCEFCETLVKHLRDILIANTTKEQFSDVLKGLCKQTGSFSTECLAIVEENYTRIYKFLVSELNGKILCTIVGICPKSLNSRYNLNYIIPMYPLVPIDLLQTQEATKIEEDSSITAKKEQNEHKPTLVVVDEQPPKVQNINVIKKSPVIDVFYKEMHFVVNDVSMPTDKTTCFLCQSILNYVQQVVTDPKSEAEIRTALEKSCLVVPSSFEQQCKQFVDQYGDAFISLIAQEVDPSIICPELKLCPVIDLSLTSNKDSESSNNCPMCVIFMSALESEISNKDTEEVIKKKLEKLCTKLPLKWKGECTEFVSTQLQSILDMLVAQVKPEEICVLLDICKPKTISESAENDLDTNMIATAGQITIVFPGYNMGQLLANNYKMLEEPKVPTPFCVVCTVVMKYLNGEIKDKSNQEEIEHVLESTCRILPNVEENECQSFIDSNYQQIIKFVAIGTDPGIACMALMVCDDDKIRGKQTIDLPKKSVHLTTTEPAELDSSNSCAACEAFVTVFEDRLTNDSVSVDDMDLIELCNEVEIAHKDQCMEMIESYAQSFKNLLNQCPTWMMCEKVAMCSKNKSVAVNQFSNSRCLEGSEYWCKSWDNAKDCKAELLCKRSSWNVKIIED